MLSNIQLDFFLTNGYLVISDFASHADCDALKLQMALLIQKNQDNLPDCIFDSFTQAHANDPYFTDSADKIHFFLEPNALNKQGKLTRPLKKSLNKVGHGLHVADETFRRFSFDKRIEAICLQLGFLKVGLLQSMYLFKQAGIGDSVNWHQDDSFLYVEDSSAIGFWFALDDATTQNGCLNVIPSPDITPLKKRLRVIHGDSCWQTFDPTPFDTDNAIPLPVKKGSLVMLHGRLPHASPKNHSRTSRHAYALHLVDTTKPYPTDNWLQWPDGKGPT